jgi:hypothetical protein
VSPGSLAPVWEQMCHRGRETLAHRTKLPHSVCWKQTWLSNTKPDGTGKDDWF